MTGRNKSGSMLPDRVSPPSGDRRQRKGRCKPSYLTQMVATENYANSECFWRALFYKRRSNFDRRTGIETREDDTTGIETGTDNKYTLLVLTGVPFPTLQFNLAHCQLSAANKNNVLLSFNFHLFFIYTVVFLLIVFRIRE